MLAGAQVRLWLLETATTDGRVARDRARAALRAILARELGVGESELQLQRASDGRPLLGAREPAAGEIAFSLSHAPPFAAVALAAAGLERVGVDVELADRRVPPALIARFLTSREAVALARLAPHERGVAFLRYWTAKEACAKVLDGGLGRNLARLELSGGPGELRPAHPALAHVELLALDPAIGRSPLMQGGDGPRLVGALAAVRRGRLPVGQAESS
jgi:phosphopantetheinyl transferase